MTVRKGPVPAGRRMFVVPIEPLDRRRLRISSLKLCGSYEFGDMLGRQDVSWTSLL